ncbi:MAG: RnfABCDGE type electron transport complex subunit D, partial [Ruminococcus sp.]|nr:RnfABCDGE type electron transport complex subunit D [Ruminococcus sp.]
MFTVQKIISHKNGCIEYFIPSFLSYCREEGNLKKFTRKKTGSKTQEITDIKSHARNLMLCGRKKRRDGQGTAGISKNAKAVILASYFRQVLTMKKDILEAAGLKEKSGLPEGFAAECWRTAILLMLCGMGVYYYGMRAAAVTGVCAGSCMAADMVCLILRKKRLHIHDLSALDTGLAIACLMPAGVPYTIAAGACVFAVCIAKAPFGGRGCEIVCPAAAGYIFAEMSFPRQMSLYPKPFEPLGLSNTVTEPLYSAFSSAAG